MKRAWNALLRLVRKIPFVDRHWEVWVYIFFGGLTTIFSWAVYFLFARAILPPLLPDDATQGGLFAGAPEFVAKMLEKFFGGDNLAQAIAKGASWFLSVAFAFFTNRAFVFHDESRGLAMLSKLGSFYGSRVVSGLLFEIIGFILLNAVMPEIAALLLTSVAVVIVNYIFSKLLIFRKKKAAKEDKAQGDEAQ